MTISPFFRSKINEFRLAHKSIPLYLNISLAIAKIGKTCCYSFFDEKNKNISPIYNLHACRLATNDQRVSMFLKNHTKC